MFNVLFKVAGGLLYLFPSVFLIIRTAWKGPVKGDAVQTRFDTEKTELVTLPGTIYLHPVAIVYTDVVDMASAEVRLLCLSDGRIKNGVVTKPPFV